MMRPPSPLGSPQHLVWSDHELPTEFQLETTMVMMIKHKSLQPFGMFSCAWPFQLHGVSWTEGGGGDEEHAGERDTCCTGWVREDTWWDNTGKKEAKADVGESWHHGEERLEDKNRDINYLWPHPICPPCSPGTEKPVLLISCGRMRESGGLSSGNPPQLKGCLCVFVHRGEGRCQM